MHYMKERLLESGVNWLDTALHVYYSMFFFLSLYVFFFQPVPTLVFFQVIFMYG